MKINWILLLFLLSSCIIDPSGDYRFKVINHTNHLITIEYNIDTIPEYPAINDTWLYLQDSIKINDTLKVLEYSYKPWPYFFERSKNKKVNLFIYNLELLKKYNHIDTLIKRKLYKRLEYSEKELNELDWTVEVKN